MSRFFFPPPPYLALALPLVAALAGGCQTARDVREWKASDHEQPEHPPAERQPQRRPSQVPAQAESPESTAMLTEIAWQKNCLTCHGPDGKGDGPQGNLFKAQDLTRPEWQASASDEQIAQTIRQGKNRMPKFDLPPEVVNGLIKRIRARKGR
ncbi:MAG TPA: cytochrome c [Polyangiaceae bacterium]|nr:cytochrome c [Polyangiaceae bacterium]